VFGFGTRSSQGRLKIRYLKQQEMAHELLWHRRGYEFKLPLHHRRPWTQEDFRRGPERTEYGSISRQGRAELRVVWVQIAHLVVRDTRRETARLRAWYAKVARKRGTKTAIVALARKLLTIAYRLLTDETDYRSSLVSRRVA